MFDWPASLRPISGSYVQFVRSLSGGQSLSGIEQVQAQLHDRWAATFAFRLRSAELILAMRSLLTQMRGRVNTIGLPAFDGRAPWAVDIYGRTIDPKFSRNRQLDGTAYEDSAGLVDSLIAATANASALINATSIDVHITTGGTPLPGHFFGIASRLYAINTVTALGGNVYRFSIWPWLRAAVSSGTAVNFTSPLCEMRFASDGEGQDDMRSLASRRSGVVTLRFDEAAPV